MEPLVVWLLIFVVFFCVLYFTVKAAVRDGILAARQAQREEQPQQDAPNEKKDGEMPSFFSWGKFRRISGPRKGSPQKSKEAKRPLLLFQAPSPQGSPETLLPLAPDRSGRWAAPF